MSKKVLLTILDGFGEDAPGPGNAITTANTPNLDRLRAEYPHGVLQAAGEAVGLVEGSMGSSEVGHFTMGAGRIVPQFLLAINNAIKDESFFEKKPFLDAFDYVRKTGKKLHLMGMISDKGVHSHLAHMMALALFAKESDVEKIYIHAIADGRDVEERSVKKYLKQLQNHLDEFDCGEIATLVGRYFTMDRDKNWDRVQKGYNLMTKGEGDKFPNAEEAVDHHYAQSDTLTDYYIPPIIINNEGLIESGDAVIFTNFRTDRTRQITSAFVDPDFKEFERNVSDIHFVCMSPYSDIAPVVFPMEAPKNNLAEWLSTNKVPQLRVAETEKYAHVTFFFNSQVEHHKEGEDRVLVPSPKVPSYAEKPEMSAPEVTTEVINALNEQKHTVIIVNYANLDLVGHSGDFDATVKAVECIDEQLGKLHEEAMKNGYTLLITGDHGNAEDMLYADGAQKPAHSENHVLLLVADPEKSIKEVKDGGLKDVAPTVLKLIDLEAPPEMTGNPLI